MLMNFRALLNAQLEWTLNGIHSDRYRNYLKKFGRLLFLLSLISGSSFAAVRLANSNLFGLAAFSMGLSSNDLTKYNQKRLTSVIVCENIPQLIIQSVFLYFSDDLLSTIVIFAMISSIISIAAAIWEHMTQKQFVKHDLISILFSVKLTSDYIKKHRKQFIHRRNSLRSQICQIFEVDRASVEILTPGFFIHNKYGKGITLNVLINTRIMTGDEFEHKMANFMSQNTGLDNESNGNCYFAKQIYDAWSVGFKREIGPIYAFDYIWMNKFSNDNGGIGLTMNRMVSNTGNSIRSRSTRTDSNVSSSNVTETATVDGNRSGDDNPTLRDTQTHAGTGDQDVSHQGVVNAIAIEAILAVDNIDQMTSLGSGELELQENDHDIRYNADGDQSESYL